MCNFIPYGTARYNTLYTFSSIMRASVPFQNSLQDRFLNRPRIKKKKKMIVKKYFTSDSRQQFFVMITSRTEITRRLRLIVWPAVLHSFRTVPNFLDTTHAIQWHIIIYTYYRHVYTNKRRYLIVTHKLALWHTESTNIKVHKSMSNIPIVAHAIIDTRLQSILFSALL